MRVKKQRTPGQAQQGQQGMLFPTGWTLGSLEEPSFTPKGPEEWCEGHEKRLHPLSSPLTRQPAVLPPKPPPHKSSESDSPGLALHLPDLDEGRRRVCLRLGQRRLPPDSAERPSGPPGGGKRKQPVRRARPATTPTSVRLWRACRRPSSPPESVCSVLGRPEQPPPPPPPPPPPRFALEGAARPLGGTRRAGRLGGALLQGATAGPLSTCRRQRAGGHARKAALQRHASPPPRARPDGPSACRARATPPQS